MLKQIRAADANSEEFRYLPGDAAVLVQIIQIEGPVEFVGDGPS